MMSDAIRFYHSLTGHAPFSARYPIRDIFKRFYPSYIDSNQVSATQQKTANCKTGGLGYNVSYCEDCGHLSIHACACNNRNCPNCQAPLEEKWITQRNSELISGVAYYHLIFTVPHELNHLMYAN